MSTAEMFLAAMLLAGVPESPVPTISQDDWPAVQEAICERAIEMQILDKRELQFLFTRAEEFRNDINILRRRQQDLRNAPRLEDCDRFPKRDDVNSMLNFNRGFRQQMEAKRIAEPHKADDYGNAIQEAERLHQVWDAVRDARCDFYYVTVRRQALAKLRTAAGEDAYHSGQLPPCVPTWRFQEVK